MVPIMADSREGSGMMVVLVTTAARGGAACRFVSSCRVVNTDGMTCAKGSRYGLGPMIPVGRAIELLA